MEEYHLSPDELIAKTFRMIQTSRHGYYPHGKSIRTKCLSEQSRTKCQKAEQSVRPSYCIYSYCIIVEQALSQRRVQSQRGKVACPLYRVTLTNLAIALHYLISCCSFQRFKNSRRISPPSPNLWDLNIWNIAKRLNGWNALNSWN